MCQGVSTSDICSIFGASLNLVVAEAWQISYADHSDALRWCRRGKHGRLQSPCYWYTVCCSITMLSFTFKHYLMTLRRNKSHGDKINPDLQGTKLFMLLLHNGDCFFTSECNFKYQFWFIKCRNGLWPCKELLAYPRNNGELLASIHWPQKWKCGNL